MKKNKCELNYLLIYGKRNSINLNFKVIVGIGIILSIGDPRD